MAKKIDKVHDLIHKLTPSEKRYVKLFAKGSRSTSNNKYLQLFDTLSRQPIYEESALLKKFGYGKNPNGLSVAKNYLFQLILKCLRNYNSNKSIDAEVIDLLQDIQSLYVKRLFGAAQRLIYKARKLAEEANREDLILLICTRERRLVEQVSEASEYVKAYENIMEVEKNATLTLETNTTLYTQYKKLQFNNLSQGLRKGDTARDVFFDLFNHPLLEEGRVPINPVSQLYYWMCYFEYYSGILDIENCCQTALRIIRHFNKYPFLKINDQGSYLNCASNYLYFLLKSGKVVTFQEEVLKFKNLKIALNDHFLVRKKEIDYFNLMIFFYESTGAYQEAIEVLVPQIKTYFETNKHGLIDKDEFYLKNTCAWLFLVTGQPEEAAIWLSYLDNEINRNTFLEYFIVCRFLLMAVHYTLGNYLLVESLSRSTGRVLEAKQRLTSSDAFMLKFFKKAGAANDDPIKQHRLLKEFKEDINTIFLYSSHNLPYRIDGVVSWVDSILLKKPLAEILLLKSERVRNNAEKAGRQIALLPHKNFVIRQ